MSQSQPVTVTIKSCLDLGMSAVEIVQRLCLEHGGEVVPSIDELEKLVDDLRNLPDLTPTAKA